MEETIPTHETVRLWMQRLGLGRMRNAEKRSGATWLVDHTNQIGKEKVLTVMRICSAPRPGVALGHQHVEILATFPGEAWKCEDVAKRYQELEAHYGTPQAVVTDGASELRDAVETLGKPGERPFVFRDPKHFLANRLKALLKRDPNYEAFTAAIGRSRSALQQTELARFIPPPFKSKARLMNWEPILRWASSVLWHLNHPTSTSCQEVTLERLEEKLGWLRPFASSIAQWQACQQVIDATLTLLNEQGIVAGVAEAYQQAVAGLANDPASQQLVSDMKALLAEYEEKLQPGQRQRISTEILESSFSLYKQLEQQQSKSGFTSLLIAFPTLLHKTTAQEVTQCFAAVKVADVKAWAKKYFPSTLASQRQRMFREANPRPKRPRKKRATAFAAAG